jgi:hypothetical protein
MTIAHTAGLAALLLLVPETVPLMTDPQPALTLEVQQHGSMIEVRLIGLSPRTQQVSYSLEITGQSTSRHRGKTTLTADTPAVLSTMRTETGDKDWCVKMVAEEEGGAPYEVVRGTCAPAVE